MKVLKKKDKILFNNNDISFGNLSINNDTLTLEIIKTQPAFRNQKYGTNTLKGILKYISKELKYKKIYLNPLPLDSDGLKLEKLITFYKKFGFIKSNRADISYPYLMEKELFR
ncbi:hypothetical protein CRV01_10990 [Arcobacter sp. CECT 8983]|uniref:GNAT family N-acetyltransferase n=1 Tax=Arcobacter sp. CECT 8983 TaxID=2044508 RepID=UPI00100B2BBA|nr:GNAT family N-acetyltransferase [Arcobacter sp. CECT 8983]RXJ89134.1 hypothetical protein CRV01_10990 [Arcobacter sp. CECT 8983]